MKRLSLILTLLFSFQAPIFAQNPKELIRYTNEREKMVEDQIRKRGIADEKVLHAMRTVPRHLFVPESLRMRAYGDHPLPIGEGQTISQPYIVALMTEQLKLREESRVLEIGTGSGYQAAVLSMITRHVYSIEIKKPLYENASKTLTSLGYPHIHVRHGDGYFGWDEVKPFDAIMVTAAVDHVPPPLLKQLHQSGRLILPLGNPFSYQNLVLISKKGNDLVTDQICGVLFVPLTGHAMKEK